MDWPPPKVSKVRVGADRQGRPEPPNRSEGALGSRSGAVDGDQEDVAWRQHARVTTAALARPSGRTQHILHSVEAETRKLYANIPETMRVKNTEFETEQRRVANFVEFIAKGRGSRALAEALAASERRAQELRVDLDALRESRGAVFQAPPLPWVEERVARLQEYWSDARRSPGCCSGSCSDGGSKPLRCWRRRESNPKEAITLTWRWRTTFSIQVRFYCRLLPECTPLLSSPFPSGQPQSGRYRGNEILKHTPCRC